MLRQAADCHEFKWTLSFLCVFLGLKSGQSKAGQGNGSRGNSHTDPHATFSSFFHGSDHFDIFFGNDNDAEEDPFNPFRRFPNSHAGGFPDGPGRGQRRLQGDEVVHDLLVTLDEVMQGCTKHVKITRGRLHPDGRGGLRSEEKVLNVVVKKGWKAGTKITFPREGDETPNSTAADVTFVLRDQEHAHYKRDGSNIVFTAKITLKEVSLVHLCQTSRSRERLLPRRFVLIHYETHARPISRCM